MKIIRFGDKCFYHIYNRGVDRRKIFTEDGDYFRFIHSLYEFNDKHFALPHDRWFRENISKRPRQLLVNIICFCLMPNHFHIVLEQLKESGITKFMQKLGTGYTMYFNTKHKREGVLFQGKFKAIPIENDEYLLHLSRYIHLNPVKLIQPNWEEINDLAIARPFLEGYRWSSFQDYIGIKNFPSVINKDFLQQYFKDNLKHRQFVENFLEKDVTKIKELLLEDWRESV